MSTPTAREIIELLSARKTVIALLIAAVVSSLLYAQLGWGANYPVLAVLGLLSVSLLICLILNASRWWTRARPLLLFHLGLLGLALAAIVSGLTYFHGSFQLVVEQSGGKSFSTAGQGPLYRDRLGDFEFALLSSRIVFHEQDLGVAVDENVVEIRRDREPPAIETIRFNEPALYGHYRFYLAPSQGFALIFRFGDEDGRQSPVVIFLPDYPESREAQSQSVAIPGSGTGPLTASVDLSSGPYDEERAWVLTSPRDEPVTVSYTLNGERKRARLQAGESLELPGGVMRFEGIRPWHRFLVDYDPARAWMSLFVSVSIVGLSWHYVALLFKKRRLRKTGGGD